jgi:hypothetical protein
MAFFSNRMKYSKQSIVIGTIFLACIIYVAFFKKDYRLKLREESTEVVIGQITRQYVKGGSYLNFIYTYEGNTMTGGRNITDVLYSPERFVNKFFPVVVSKKNGTNSAILITPKDFAFFEKEFPDSLTWVVQWVQEKGN